MTLGKLCCMAKAVQRLQWDQTSLIWCTLANANRDTKQHPKPFSPADVHPFRSASDYARAETEPSDLPDFALIEQIRRQHKVSKLHGSPNN